MMRLFIVCAALLMMAVPCVGHAQSLTTQTQATPSPPPRTFVGDAYYQPYLKAVLQSQLPSDQAGLAIWSPDEKFIIAIVGADGSVAGKDMSLVIWDFRSGTIVNRVPFPAHLGTSSIYIQSMAIDAKSTVTITASITSDSASTCESKTLSYKFGKTNVWVNKANLAATASCTVPQWVRGTSPSGLYKMMDSSKGLAVIEAESGLLVGAMEKPEAFVISDAALSPGGKTMAILAARVRMSEKYSAPIILFDLKSSTLRDISLGTRDPYDRVHWLNDRQFILLSADGTGPILTLDAETGQQSAPPLDGQCLSGAPGEMITIAATTVACKKSAAGETLRLYTANDFNLEYDGAKGIATLTTQEDGQPRRVLFYTDVVAAGKMPNSNLFWVASKYAGLRFGGGQSADGPSGLEALSVTFFRQGKYLAQTHYGSRYDTNLGADTGLIRWVNSNDGMTSLGPQTFMREFFQPQLARRILDCQKDGSCRDVFKTSLPRINTTLPTVTIDRVTPGPEANTAIVDMTVREGQGMDAYKKVKATQGYNLRLFRNGSLIAQFPERGAETDGADIAIWRKRNLVSADQGSARRVSLTVSLPTSTKAQDLRLTAYAFNEDRIKSETASAAYTQPAVTLPRPRRAFIVTFGIDSYAEKRLSLQFAARDARLLGKQLAVIPGYEVRQAIIAPTEDATKPLPVTAVMMRQVLGILAGRDVGASIKALKQQGVDASQLDASTPDDIVIISFAGHGWADKDGAFYLVPSEGKWPAGPEPVRSTLVSAVQIANQLRGVDAAEMALIIDACHSAGSVDSGSFKPGPMGDPGLGQLAFDKGIRIIAATQASDVALEDANLSQGLLTYALASEGITEKGGKADGNGDGRITVDEWLAYGAKRVPALSIDARLGRIQPGSRAMAVIGGPIESRVKQQEPAVFDFTGVPSTIILRTGVTP